MPDLIPKTEPPTELNIGLPIAHGLVFAVAFTEGGGVPRELVLGAIGTDMSSTPWGIGLLGPEALTDGNGDGWSFPGFVSNPSEWSCLWVGHIDAANASFASTSVHSSTSGSNGWRLVPYGSGASAGKPSLVKSGVIGADFTSISAATLGRMYAIASGGNATVADCARMDLVTGSIETQTGVNITGTPASGNGTYSVGRYGPDSGGFGVNGANSLVFAWNRKLTIHELIESVSDYDVLIRPVKGTIGNSIAAAGGYTPQGSRIYSRYFNDARTFTGY